MTITMAFGSFIGGATAEGGGAVAFPVMTLVLHLSPAVARDFSFMIQCCGKKHFLTALGLIVTSLLRIFGTFSAFESAMQYNAVSAIRKIPNEIVLQCSKSKISVLSKHQLLVKIWFWYSDEQACLYSQKT